MATAINLRDIEILHTLYELTHYWREHPQLRLGQILVNVGPERVDPFYVLDVHYRNALAAANSATSEPLSPQSGTDTRSTTLSPQMGARGGTDD